MNMEIYVGKDPEKMVISAAVELQGKFKTVVLPELGNVPASVSRLMPAAGKSHCRIEVQPDGSMLIENMNPANSTYVNGNEIVKKRVAGDAKVELGVDRFPLDLNAVLSSVSSVLPASIAPLEAVWNEYERRKEAIAKKQLDRGRKRLLPMIIGAVSGILAPILGTLGTGTLFITVPIAVVSLLIYIRMFSEKDTSIEDNKAAQDYLIDNYICPKCGHFLGNIPYKVLRQNKKCSYCGKEWRE